MKMRSSFPRRTFFRGATLSAGSVLLAPFLQRLEAAPGTELTVDLEARQVRCGDLVAEFQIDDYVRWRLLEGLDDIALTLAHTDEISKFESGRPTYKPTVR